MVYSCAYYTDWTNDVAQAQRDKLEMICRKLRLKPGERMLDIGSGWGGLVCHAAKNYGVTAHGFTLSEEQLAFAREKVKRLGLEKQVTFELIDYSQRHAAPSTRSPPSACTSTSGSPTSRRT